MPSSRNGLLLAVDEFAHTVDAAQLQDAVAHRHFEQYRGGCARSDVKDHLAHRDAEDFLRLRIERQR